MATTGEDPLSNFDLWCDLIGAIQKECVPSCIRSTRRKHSPWITPDIMKAARRKRALFKKASRTNCPRALQVAEDHQRSLKAAIYVAHQQYAAGIAQKARDDPKVFWSYVSRLRSPGHRPSFSANGRMIGAPAEVAELFANHFSSVYGGAIQTPHSGPSPQAGACVQIQTTARSWNPSPLLKRHSAPPSPKSSPPKALAQTVWHQTFSK